MKPKGENSFIREYVLKLDSILENDIPWTS